MTKGGDQMTVQRDAKIDWLAPHTWPARYQMPYRVGEAVLMILGVAWVLERVGLL